MLEHTLLKLNYTKQMLEYKFPTVTLHDRRLEYNFSEAKSRKRNVGI